MTWSYIVFAAFVFISCEADRHDGFDEKNLVTKILRSYDKAAKRVRPVKDSSSNVTVSMSATLLSVNVDKANNVLKSNIWLNLQWTDEFLKWNSKKYGVDQIRLRQSDIWTPDITLYNGASAFTPFDESLAVVRSNGNVLTVSKYRAKSLCTFVKGDDQTCSLKFGSWTYDGGRIDLKLTDPNMDVSYFYPSSDYKLVSAKGERHSKVYSCCPEVYVDVLYTIKLKRNRK